LTAGSGTFCHRECDAFRPVRAEALPEGMGPWNTLVEIIRDSPDEPRPRVRDLAWPTVPSMHHNSSSIGDLQAARLASLEESLN
jgi:hypothetical protein